MFEVVVVNQYTNKLENINRTANGKDWRAYFLIKPLAIPLTNQHLDKYLVLLGMVFHCRINGSSFDWP